MGSAAGPLTAGEMVPSLALPEADGGVVRLRGYRGRRNLVLLLLHGPTCPQCRDRLEQVASAYDQIAAQEGELVVVLPAPAPDAAAVKRRLGLRCPVVGDQDLAAYRASGALDDRGQPQAALAVTDRYGEVYHAAVAGAEHDLPSVAAVLGWLVFIEVQCPECGVAEAPWAGVGGR